MAPFQGTFVNFRKATYLVGGWATSWKKTSQIGSWNPNSRGKHKQHMKPLPGDCLTLWKANMTMEKQAWTMNEDVSPLKHGDFQASHVSSLIIYLKFH